jgi:hypothetical protein
MMTELLLSYNSPDCSALQALFVCLAKLPHLQQLQNDIWADGANFKAAARLQGSINDAPAAAMAPAAAAAAAASDYGNAALLLVALVPFANLRHLRIYLCLGNIKYLLQAAPLLTELNITVNTGVRAELADLAPLTALRELIVYYNSDVAACPLTPRNVAGLQHLRELRRLCIFAASGCDTGVGVHRLLTDNDFLRLAAALPHLTHLAILVGASAATLTSATLRSVSQHCRQLQTLEIDRDGDVTCWRDIKVMPLFPQLKRLKLTRVSIEQGAAGTNG